MPVVKDIEKKEDITRHLAVGDYLRTHPDDANGKDAFVKELERNALQWDKMCNER